jgi:acetate kinase
MQPDSPPLIAVLNAGSSTLKFSLLRQEKTLLRALLEIGADAKAQVKDETGAVCSSQSIAAPTHEAALAWLFDWLRQARPQLRMAAAGHRVVHGGEHFTAPARVTAELITQLEALIPLAPLHQPHNLAPMRYLAAHHPELPQVACFDTAFHAGQARRERMFALPRHYWDEGIRRYGFHGLSYEYIASRLLEYDPRAAAGKAIVCHLGNGASLCALDAGRSIATTMAFTALEGLPMGTRCGAIDPGVLLYLLEHERLSPAQLADVLYKRSGLLGISGESSDMRALLVSPRPEAAEAVEYFCYRIAREIGSLAAALGGVDALVFTGGIGEHAAPVRARVCELSAWLGARLDARANASHQATLHEAASAISLLLIPTDEERMIASHALRLLASKP